MVAGRNELEDSNGSETEARVNFRWGREQLDLVKRAARLMGVPYQTYIKQVVYRQCMVDLKAAASVPEDR